ncbi:methyl-accepting chemotaxis protein [Pseudooceanicola antarcticus]|uniref:Methyl-accepting chemotaxis protein n=1 Tax=Pseudooceanicola antarcticus TaxID=1247613 RepID=A0A285ITA4_9RHOB|nr:methyl-accepting chemotaxis protein [Pseudooceanicola antarcticus]PJE32014.1 methyl-accepting chemotaxis protein [Pseudooceanicola antarcticus]SNY51245.1 methyl-accepting chemotaxis protein [Pseudooceanicola antarcticus]
MLAIFRRLTGGIGTKITFVLLAISLAAGFGGTTALMVFDKISGEMDTLTGDMLNQVQRSAILMQAANGTRDVVTRTLLVQTEDQLAEQRSAIAKALEFLDESVRQVPGETRQELRAATSDVRLALEQLSGSRAEEFRQEREISLLIGQLQSRSEALQGKLAELADDAYFNLVMGGEETIEVVDRTLAALVDSEFAALQAVLTTRADLNLLTGVALASSGSAREGTGAILADLGKGAADRLEARLVELEGFETISLDTDRLREALQVFRQASGGRGLSATMRDRVLSARQETDVELSSAVDDLYFELTIAAEDAAGTNRDTIQGLMDTEFGFLMQLLTLNSAVSAFSSAAIEIVSGTDPEAVSSDAAALIGAAGRLQALRDLGNGKVAEELDGLTALADPSGGLVAAQVAVLRAQERAAAASDAAVDKVQAIVDRAAALTAQSEEEIRALASGISAEVSAASSRMREVAMIVVAVLVASFFLTWLFILRPLWRVSGTTERLASGNLSPVTGFEHMEGEVGRIARALAIFRDGLVERQEVAKAAEAEREAHRAAQEAAVASLAKALERLSAGDLTVRITTPMSAGYEKLRTDFNQAMETLEVSISTLSQNGQSIAAASAEISNVSRELASRSEQTAGTLAGTATAIDRLSNSISETARASGEARDAVGHACRRADDSVTVVRRTIEAMEGVKDSASKIEQIIDLMEGITFQTSLLALNAGVEAARAGEAGRGFAVVASEVRALAQRSKDAADEITGLVQASRKQVDQGFELVNSTRETIDEISTSILNASGLMSNISDQVVEQSSSLTEINGSMSSLDEATMKNTAMLEEVSSANVSLSEEAQGMSVAIGQFRLTDAAAGAAPPQARRDVA